MKAGFVSLVGAGPGDPGLITVKGLECVRAADVVVYDRLVDRRILDHAKGDAEMIDVGKVPGDGGKRQQAINSVLVEKARGNYVVRLKGGDPFVFGRGGEEAEVLHAEGVPFEIVPGVTSAIAAPAYAGIPLTHRGVASSFTVVTGSESPDKPNSAIDWEGLANTNGTLVTLMGWESLPGIVSSLIRGGRSPETPAALVQWGTEPQQRTVVGTLANVVVRAETANLSPPVVAVIGDVVALRDRLRWFDTGPLFGKRVLVTRTRAQAGTLSGALANIGAQVRELPTIEIRPLEDYSELDSALRRVASYDWLVFTSVNAVQTCFERLAAIGLDARAIGPAKIAAVGPATATELRRLGIAPDFVPESYVAESVVDGLRNVGVVGARVLLPRADIAHGDLVEGLKAAGAHVHGVTAYHTARPDDSAGCLRRILAEGIDVVTFTSSSTVRNLVDVLEGDVAALSGATVACIGPVTESTAKGLGLNVDIVPKEHTVAGLVESLEGYFASREGMRQDDGADINESPRG